MAATYRVTGPQSGGRRRLASLPELLANDEICAAEIALYAGAIPENPECSRGGLGDHSGVEGLQTIARPFRGAAPLIRGAKKRAALRMQFVEEEAC